MIHNNPTLRLYNNYISPMIQGFYKKDLDSWHVWNDGIENENKKFFFRDRSKNKKFILVKIKTHICEDLIFFFHMILWFTFIPILFSFLLPHTKYTFVVLSKFKKIHTIWKLN